jgi:hypothetical protein
MPAFTVVRGRGAHLGRAAIVVAVILLVIAGLIIFALLADPAAGAV